MNLLKLAVGFASLLPAAWMAITCSAVFALVAVHSGDDMLCALCWTMTGVEGAAALVIVSAAWYARSRSVIQPCPEGEGEAMWRNTFNSELKGTIWGLGRMRELAEEAGYTFYTWNGWVYPTNGAFHEGTRVMLASDLR